MHAVAVTGAIEVVGRAGVRAHPVQRLVVVPEEGHRVATVLRRDAEGCLDLVGTVQGDGVVMITITVEQHEESTAWTTCVASDGPHDFALVLADGSGGFVTARGTVEHLRSVR